MNNELIQRIITSIFLFISIIFCILINKFFFIVTMSILLLLVAAREWFYINKKNMKIFVIGFIYLCFVLFTLLNLRGNSIHEAIFLILILSICAGSDVGGYVFGKTFGGRKLIKISPNKTVSGSLGSFIFSILPIFIFNFQSFIIFNFTFKNILFCLLVSLICQIGDLIISYFKRANKIKNTGSLLPGHGGILDRIDGMIFAIPFVYFLKLIQLF
jgi:phosphatidate cytidylyltransferase